MRLFWHQRDLRLPDNRGPSAAADGPVVPVFVVDAAFLSRIGTRQRAFLLRGVQRLQAAYRNRGSGLLVVEGTPAAVLPDVAAEYGADGVVYNEHYRPARRTRQRNVESACAAAGLDVEAVTDLTLVDPRRLAERYENHGRFSDDWQQVERERLAPSYSDPVVDRDEGYERARRVFERAFGMR